MGFFSKLNRKVLASAEALGAIYNLESLVKLSSLDIGYVPWTSSSMTPRAITYILNEIVVNNKSRVLELGMGISSLYIAKLMAELSRVSLLSIDHDEAWIKVCQDQIREKELKRSQHKIIHAPLTQTKNDGTAEPTYYDLEPFLDELASFSPDLLIIDGPPAWKPDISGARVPAHQFFAPLLSMNSTVFIDDYTRQGEGRLLESFLATPGWNVEIKDPWANIAILRNNSCNYNSF